MMQQKKIFIAINLPNAKTVDQVIFCFYLLHIRIIPFLINYAYVRFTSYDFVVKYNIYWYFNTYYTVGYNNCVPYFIECETCQNAIQRHYRVFLSFHYEQRQCLQDRGNAMLYNVEFWQCFQFQYILIRTRRAN